MGLSAEEYENIWLRTKDKATGIILKAALALVTVTGGVVGTTVYQIAINSVDSRIAKYAETAEFQATLRDTLDSLRPSLAAETANAQAALEDLRKYITTARTAGASIEGNHLTFISDGKIVRLEHGMGIGSGVQFTHEFTKPPTVIATRYFPNKDRPLVINDVTRKGFHVGITEISNYFWIAIGE